MAKKDARNPYGLRIPPKGKTYVYDFQYPPGGPRYSKSTRSSVYREALKVAASAYSEVEAAYKRQEKAPNAKPQMPLREAFGRFYLEKGVHYAAPKNCLGILNRIATSLGPDRLLSDVTPSLLLEYRTERAKVVSNRTVNTDVVDTMRAVYKQARLWGVELGELGSRDFEWGTIKLEASAHRTRVLTKDEQARLFEHMREDFKPIIRFALLTGLRLAAWFIRRDQIDWTNNVIVYKKKSKRTNDMGMIPMTAQVQELIREEIRRGGEDCEWVFTYECQLSRGNRKAGDRIPMTRNGVQSYMQRLQAHEGVRLGDVRLHDLRHTAATEVLRAGANIISVQMLLGHSDSSQTSRYTNLVMPDVAEALERRDRHSHEITRESGLSSGGGKK